jgi:hypothetical protein
MWMTAAAQRKSGSLGIAVMESKCGVIFGAVRQKQPHLPPLPGEISTIRKSF